MFSGSIHAILGENGAAINLDEIGLWGESQTLGDSLEWSENQQLESSHRSKFGHRYGVPTFFTF